MEEKFKTFKELVLYTVEDNKEFLYHLRHSYNLFDRTLAYPVLSEAEEKLTLIFNVNSQVLTCSYVTGAYYVSEKQWNSHYINKRYIIFTREGVK
jgi:hypothetical protein